MDKTRTPFSHDAELFDLIKQEELRQELVLRLIPSENYVSRAVMEATGSVLTNKYSEGYPGKRYYQGQEFIDKIESLTVERAKVLFGADHANVQPYSGSIAVLACYMAVCEPGDTVMGPLLAHGGHLSHGHPVNVTGKLYSAVQYGVDKETENFNFSEIEKAAIQARPKIIIAGGTAFPRSLDYAAFGAIAKKVGAIFLADVSHVAGLIVGGVHPHPFPHADIVVSTSHKTLRGPRGAFIVCKSEFRDRIDKAVFPLLQGGPHQHTQAGIGTAFFEAMQPRFRTYAKQIVENTQCLAKVLSEGGLRLITKGSDNHLLLADVTSLGWTSGRDAAVQLERAGLVVNSNMIPFDRGSAFKPSGIRLGTPALTTRGMAQSEMTIVGELILSILASPNPSDSVLRDARSKVRDLCLEFPVPSYFV